MAVMASFATCCWAIDFIKVLAVTFATLFPVLNPIGDAPIFLSPIGAPIHRADYHDAENRLGNFHRDLLRLSTRPAEAPPIKCTSPASNPESCNTSKVLRVAPRFYLLPNVQPSPELVP